MNVKIKQIIACCVWVCLYILCVGLGTVESVQGFGKILFVLTALIFFLPGVYLLYLGHRERSRSCLLVVRIAAICSLVLTVGIFSANVIAVTASAQVGKNLYDILNVVSAPMFCSQYWILSLFCWSCLLSASFVKWKKK